MKTTLKTGGDPIAETPAVTAPRIKPDLTLVQAPPPALKAQQLYAEARKASLDHLQALEAAIDRARELSDGVVAGGELYGPGLRDLARRLSEDLSWKAKTLQVLSRRQAGG